MKRLLLLLALTGLLGSAWYLSKQASVPVSSLLELPQAPPAGDQDPVLTVNGRAVPRWLLTYWLERSCENAQKQAAAQGQAPDWSAQGPGSLRQTVREQAIADAALCALVQDLCLTRAAPQDPIRQVSPAPQPPQSARPPEAPAAAPVCPAGQASGLEDYGRCYHWLRTQAARPGSAGSPTPEQLAQVAKTGNFLAVDRILVTGEDAPARIASLFSRLNQAPDPAALFPLLAAEGEDRTGPRTLQLGDGQLSPALEAAALSLEVGSHSGILSDGEGCAILLRTPPDLRILTEAWVDQSLLRALRDADIRLLPAFQAISIPPCPGMDTA